MSKPILPGADWPPPLMTSDPGSFARRTIIERKPQIIRRVIEDNAYPEDIVQALEAFATEIAAEPIARLDEGAQDTTFWNQELSAYHGKTWLEVPWYFAEAYFYRRLLGTVRYFDSDRRGERDPFEKQKRDQTQLAVERLAQDWDQLTYAEPIVAFEALLHSCLWGNRADLSNFTVKVKALGGLIAREERRHILIDHTDQIGQLLAIQSDGDPPVQRLDFVSDNVGMDLLFDLVLVDFLFLQNSLRKVVFHLKDRPFFVSDAMIKDVHTTVASLCEAYEPSVREIGQRLREHVGSGRLELKDDPFWTSCRMFHQLPLGLQEELSRADLVILKGDVNYRRLLGDRHWPHTARLEEIADFFPAPFLVLRTLKGEIMVGLGPGRAEALASEDPTWLINGKRGIIQLVTAPSSERIGRLVSAG